MEHLVRAFGALAVAALTWGCTHHEVEVKPIRVETIRIEMDVNIRLQQNLEEMFAFEEEMEKSEKGKKPGKNGT